MKRDRPSLLQGPRLVQSGTARLLLHAPRGRTTNVDTTTLRPVRRYARGPNFGRVRPPALYHASTRRIVTRRPRRNFGLLRWEILYRQRYPVFSVSSTLSFATDLLTRPVSFVTRRQSDRDFAPTLVDLSILLFFGVYSSTIRVKVDVSWNLF